MSDFLLDFRERETRARVTSQTVSMLRFCEDTRAKVFERDSFTLVVTRVDQPFLWDPYRCVSGDNEIIVALCGRIALDEKEWDAAREVEGMGGLACKAIYNLYQQEGIKGFSKLNGNFLAILFDQRAATIHLVTDRCGAYPAYGTTSAQIPAAYSSHPDVLAAVLGESQNWDMTSLAEFLMTSRVSYPYTYYRTIHALDFGCVYSTHLGNGSSTLAPQVHNFRPNFKLDSRLTEQDLAEQLAAAFMKSVRRRTLPMLGGAAVALSGGLDSRALLAAARPVKQVRAFTLFDEKNLEFEVAKAVAEACQVDLLSLRRDFEYYGNSADLAVRISGGTGCISNNHFLGVRQPLKELGIESILTGCYCDYLFKGLALNVVEGSISRRQKLGRFRHEFYDPCNSFDTASRDGVIARLDTIFPESTKGHLSEEDWLNIERKRVFPLAYEQDLTQRVIPQRVMPWYLPVADNDIVNVYLRIPCRFKLNGSLFRRMVTLLCTDELCRIPESNTGAAVNASWPTRALHRHLSRLQNRVSDTVASRMATRGSWPNWLYYLRHSKKIALIWGRPNPVADQVFFGILGTKRYSNDIESYLPNDIPLFQRLLTLKIWLDQRNSVG